MDDGYINSVKSKCEHPQQGHNSHGGTWDIWLKVATYAIEVTVASPPKPA